MLALTRLVAKLFYHNRGELSLFTQPRVSTANTIDAPWRHNNDRRHDMKAALLSDPHCRFYLLDRTGHVVCFHSPVLLNDDEKDENVIIAIHGDGINGKTHIKFNADAFFQVCVAPVAPTHANTLGARHLHCKFEDLRNKNDEPAAFHDIGYEPPVANDTTNPVLIFMDKVAAIPPTYRALDGHNIEKAFPASSETHPETYGPTKPVIAAWRTLDGNSGGSLHHGNSYSQLASAVWLEQDDGAGAGFQDLKNIGKDLATCIHTEFTFVPATHKLVLAAAASIEEKMTTALSTEAQELDEIASATTRPPGSSPAVSHAPAFSPAGEDATKQLAEVMTSLSKNLQSTTEGSKSTLKKKLMQRYMHRYQLVYGAVEKLSDGTEVWKPAILTPRFIEFMECDDKEEAKRMLRLAFVDAIAVAKKKKDLLGLCSDYNPDCINTTFTTCTKNAHFTNEPLNVSMTSIDQAISTFCFLPVDANNAKLIRMNSSEQAAKVAHIHGETKEAKVRELFVHGEQTQVSCIKATNLNLQVFGTVIAVDYDKSFMYKKLMELYEIHDSLGGTAWLKKVVANKPAMIHSVLMDIEAIRLAISYPLLNNIAFQSAMERGEDISASDVIAGSTTVCQTVLNNAMSAVGGSYHLYETPLRSFNWFTQAHSDGRGADRAAGGDSGGSPPKRQRQEPRREEHDGGRDRRRDTPQLSDREMETRKGRGFLKCTGTLRHCSIRFSQWSNKTLCTKFATRGYYCTFDSRDCQFAHIDPRNVCNADIAKLNEWLNRTPSMSYNDPNLAPTGNDPPRDRP